MYKYFLSDTNLSNKAWTATVNDGMEELGGLYTKPMIIFLSVFSGSLSTFTNTELISPPIIKAFLDLHWRDSCKYNETPPPLL